MDAEGRAWYLRRVHDMLFAASDSYAGASVM
jgi:hypothetical protein